MTVTVIVAADDGDVIGAGNDLPWHLPADLARFRRLTLGHAVIMGMSTYRSIEGRLGGPLPGRLSVVLTRSARHPEVPRGAAGSTPPVVAGGAAVYAGGVDAALALADRHREEHRQDRVFVAGGASVYGQFLPLADEVLLTRVRGTHDGDTTMVAGWLDGFAPSGPAEDCPGDQAPPPCTFRSYRRAGA